MESYKKNQEVFVKQAAELVAQMTLEEAASQLKYDSPAIERLGIPAYNWWNEALHGVARAGVATMFPQAIGLAAAFDEKIVGTMAEIIAEEGRAKYNEQSAQEDRDIYKGLTFWSPNVNIFRDPRWGRGQETYGEDPYLTSRLGVAYINALQGNGKYMKAAACAKHYAVHSGPEKGRHSFNAVVSEKDLWETYLPAFEACVTEGDVEAVMGAYNRTNGEPCCGHTMLMKEVLRGRWHFKGHFVSDCGAIKDFHTGHMITATAPESAALALKNGCDLNCGNTYLHLLQAYQDGLITEEEIRTAAVRLFTTRYKLGMFDEKCEYNKIPYEVNDCAAHRNHALNSSCKSMVMLKNDGLLPLNKKKIKSIAVIGPNADSIDALRGNYYGTSSCYVTNLKGIQEYVSDDTRVYYAEGCHLYKERMSDLSQEDDRLSEAVTVARHSDVVVLCLGLDGNIEGEEGDACNSFAAGDKVDLSFPKPQQKLLKAVTAVGKPVIVVVNSGSALDLSYAQEHCSAVIQAWYSGAQGGTALAELIFGEYSPSGRLPVTFYQSVKQLPDFEDYSMRNRTYRYFKGKPLYPFGYGLSYSKFAYSDFKLSASEIGIQDGVDAQVTVTNIGDIDADEVVQIYIKDEQASVQVPNDSLCGFSHITLQKGESRTLQFHIENRSFQCVAENGERFAEPGKFTLYAGGSQPDKRSFELTGVKPLEVSVFMK